FQKVVDGMFAIYQNIFGLKFEQITAPYKWIDDLQLYLVSDAATGEPLGMFYLDMFPREGKFNHFAQFDIISGKLLPDGKYQRPENAPYDCDATSNPILEKDFLPIDPSTTFVSYFGHMNGYDAGYYGYAWADAIAADMATVFEKASDRYLDKQAGLRLRHEVYEPGDSRDVTVSIETFLGRKQSIEPFLKKIGIGGEKKTKSA